MAMKPGVAPTAMGSPSMVGMATAAWVTRGGVGGVAGAWDGGLAGRVEACSVGPAALVSGVVAGPSDVAGPADVDESAVAAAAIAVA